MLRRCFGLLALLGGLLCAHGVRADELSSALYVRADTDHTVVVSPRARANKKLGEASSVDVTYAADIWSSASVDIRTSASKLPVTEQRDELDFNLSHDWEDFHLHGGYRFSSEHDYTSHGASVGGTFDFADNAATLDATLHVIADTVGQSGNPNFARSLSTVDAALSFTQVLDPKMFANLTYELALDHGYQSSPYRWVGIGDMATGFGCERAQLCLPENTPASRTRHAFALLVRRALSDAISLGVTYRYYLDDWALKSHTLLAELGWTLGDQTLLIARYRFYTQGSVDFYRERYTDLSSASQYRTRDRELSSLTYHRVGVELEHDVSVGEHAEKLALTLAVSGDFYSYANFVGLDTITALEVSAALLLEI